LRPLKGLSHRPWSTRYSRPLQMPPLHLVCLCQTCREKALFHALVRTHTAETHGMTTSTVDNALTHCGSCAQLIFHAIPCMTSDAAFSVNASGTTSATSESTRSKEDTGVQNATTNNSESRRTQLQCKREKRSVRKRANSVTHQRRSSEHPPFPFPHVRLSRKERCAYYKQQSPVSEGAQYPLLAERA